MPGFHKTLETRPTNRSYSNNLPGNRKGLYVELEGITESDPQALGESFFDRNLRQFPLRGVVERFRMPTPYDLLGTEKLRPIGQVIASIASPLFFLFFARFELIVGALRWLNRLSVHFLQTRANHR